jgi:hypothetical protein
MNSWPFFERKLLAVSLSNAKLSIIKPAKTVARTPET